MNNYHILYMGHQSGTSLHRACALQRLGHQVDIVNPRRFLPAKAAIDKWIFETGGLFLEDFIRKQVLSHLPSTNFNLVYVDGGELLGPSLICELKKRFGTVVNYNIDDPYGRRDRNKWRLYLKAVPYYDLIVSVRECNLQESLNAGARSAIRVCMSSDEVAHAAKEMTKADCLKWAADVTFIGTWMPERGPFLARLIELGVPLAIYGDRWYKAKEWPLLRPHWRCAGIYNDHDYAMSIQGSKVCLGLLSKGNRDQSTTRSFEIPHLAGVLCAERTEEHQRLYREDREAVFWNSAEECAEKCLRLLNDDSWRKAIAKNGHRRCLENGITNERILSKILASIPGRQVENQVYSTQ